MPAESTRPSPPTAPTPVGIAHVRATLARKLATLRRVIRTVHRIIGAPDYEGYLAHHARCHASARALTRDEFTRQSLDARYSRPGTRCC